MAKEEKNKNKGVDDVEGKPEKPWPKNKKAPLYLLNREAMLFWHRQLADTPHAIEFLKGRGFSNPLEISDKYQLGYAPCKEDKKRGFVSYILSRGLPEFKDSEELERGLIAAGLAKRAKNGKIYDFFYGRLMFPISQQGTLDLLPSPDTKIIGFGGRVVPHPDAEEVAGEDKAKIERKWMNTSETPIFSKGKVLYGWAWAYGDILARRQCIFLEGYMDVVQCREANYPNVVATLGTSLTEDHISLLPESTQSKDMCVYISTDDDEGGRKSAERSSMLLFEHRGKRVKVRIARPVDGLDPDDLIRLKGVEAFEEVLTGALTPLARYLEDRKENCTTGTLVALVNTLRNAAPIVSPFVKDQESDYQFLHDWVVKHFGVYIPVFTLRNILTTEYNND